MVPRGLRVALRRDMRARLVASVAALLVLVSSGAARAEQAPERTASEGGAALARRLVVAVAPLAPVGGRWGGSVEWLAAPHHALAGSLAWVDVEPACCRARPGGWSPGPNASRIHGAAVELGYRYYSARDRPAGFFLAPSLVLFRGGGRIEAEPVGAIGQVGLAVDAGAQVILFERVVLGAGLGLQAVHSDREIETGFETSDATPVLFPPPPDRYLRSHVAPRLTASLGVAF